MVHYEAGMSWQLAWTVALMLTSKFNERQAGAEPFAGGTNGQTGVEQVPSTIQKVLTACFK